MTKRRGRVGSRPLAVHQTMHLVLRSTKAKGTWSFRQPKNSREISRIVSKFATKYGVRILSLANVGNHLHFQIKLANRYTYRPFIRAITSAIAMKITGYSRWNPGHKNNPESTGFWDRRPFTRIIDGGLRAFLNLKDYIRINQLEGFGFQRDVARLIVSEESAEYQQTTLAASRGNRRF